MFLFAIQEENLFFCSSVMVNRRVFFAHQAEGYLIAYQGGMRVIFVACQGGGSTDPGLVVFCMD